MKGRKGSTDEGGVRSPFFIRWAGHFSAGQHIPQIAAAIDLLPTLADLAGIPVVGDKRRDGISLKPLLTADPSVADWPDRMIFSHWRGKVSVRTQRYRLDAAGGLFDMQADPGQRRDIAREQPQVAARLSKAVETWKRELLPALERDDRPYPVGYPQFPRTELPARDGVAHGSIQRSASAPNCSYFKNWTSIDDAITWDIEVVTAGDYEATIHYTCPQPDVGSAIELSCHGRRLEAQVLEAHDPPPVGAEHDRVPRRGESYVKDFKPLRLGSIRLEPCRDTLTLRALNVPGRQVMEVRMLELTLKQQANRRFPGAPR